MKKSVERYDVVVCGGGLAGFCAAIAAARHGAKTCLIQDRPVFGGNSSSEIRVTPHGSAAFHAYARETGILSEVLIEERATNHETIFENGWTNSVWDIVLYDVAIRTPGLSFHVNTQVIGVICGDGEPTFQTPGPDDKKGFLHRAACNTHRRITGMIARVSNAETELTIHGQTFIDCTGDGVVADLAGCEWRMGSEGYDEFNEPHAPAKASRDTMGNSIHFKTRDMGRPVPFVAPEWAVKHEKPEFFYDGGRHPRDMRGGYWWLEIGVPWDTIYQAEDIRHELTRHCLGVWDWIKNRDPRTMAHAANYALDWMGQVPGKRESRRVIGRYFMNEHDVQKKTVFPDEIAFGGWFLDLHTPGGLLAPNSEPCSAEEYSQKSEYAVKSYVGPYGLPLRVLIANDLDNLMMAGRNISVTHAALGTARVMGTTALMGQAAGTASAIALARRISPAELAESDPGAVQQALLRDGCFLPNVKNEDPADLARAAKVTASSHALLRGAGPESFSHNQGLAVWRDQVQTTGMDYLSSRRGQWIAVGTPKIDKVSVCLSNTSDVPQSVTAWIMPVEHIWDYRIETGAPLATTVLTVPPGKLQWIEWPVGASVTPGRYVRLDLDANPHVRWHSSPAIEPGQLAAYVIGPGRMRRYGNGLTMSFQVSPPQPCYGPENVLSGVTRPHRYTNLWRSDPTLPLAQYIELAWPKPQTIGQVELTFPGHLIREYHAYSPFYRDQQCARDYVLSAEINGRWEELCRVEGNYQRQRKHKLATPVSTTRLRLTIEATHGDPSAAVYEIRCYA